MQPIALEGAWRECFELAWEAFRAGTIPVGAVVADPSGTIVARGRNRIFDHTAPPGQLAGTYIAHAELNALAALPTVVSARDSGPFDDGTRSTRRSSRVRSASAPRSMVMVGEFALRLGRPLRRRRARSGSRIRTRPRLPLTLERPASTAPLGDLGELLHLAHFLWRRPDSHVLAAYRSGSPR